MKKVFMFPGQGSQARGMGKDLFDEVPEFLAIEAQADELLGYSVRQLCIEDVGDRLRQTQYTQPCLYLVNALHYYKALAQGARPDAAIGHSLGEYNALLAGGAFDLLTGLRLVARRGELMAKARDGGMAAVLGLAPEKIHDVLQRHELSSLDIANFNSPAQIVISGPVAEIDRAVPLLQEAGAGLCLPLAVSAAFHSRYMVPAAQAFDEFLAGFTFASLSLPVIANATGQPYPGGQPSATVRAMLVRQIASPVMWTHGLRQLLAWGATEFDEIGPGTVLTKLTAQIRRDWQGAAPPRAPVAAHRGSEALAAVGGEPSR